MVKAGENIPVSPFAARGAVQSACPDFAGRRVLYFYPKDNIPGCPR